MENLEAGDVVQLKSGGPKMTIQRETDSGYLYCTWFIDGKLESTTFSPESLKKIESSDED